MTTTPDHFVTINFDTDDRTMACHAPLESSCHAEWDCGCESWGKVTLPGDGTAYHIASTPLGAKEKHVAKLNPDRCNLRWWIEEGPGVLRGSATFSICEDWEGDYYAFDATDSEDLGLGQEFRKGDYVLITGGPAAGWFAQLKGDYSAGSGLIEVFFVNSEAPERRLPYHLSVKNAQLTTAEVALAGGAR